MKRILSISALFLMSLFMLTSCLDFMQTGEEGSGTVIKEDRSVSDFSKISVSEGINAFITMGDKESLTVEADDNLVPLIVTEVNGDKLVVKIKDGYGVKSSKALNVFINAETLTGLKASSAADIKMETDLTASSLSCDASSAGDINLMGVNVDDFDGNASSSGDIECERLTAKSANMNASSSGDIKFNNGSIEKANLETSSSGEISAYKVETKTCKANASSGGHIKVNVVDELSAHASSGGRVRYKGTPRMDGMHTSSGGTVKSE
jgi:hypothetical protein